MAGLFLLGALVGPAAAFVPFLAGSVVSGTIVRSVAGGVLVRVGIPIAESAASKIGAANILGVVGAGMIVVCGQNYLNGNDCSGTPLVKLRPQNHTGTDSEAAATPVAASGGTSTAAVLSGTRWNWYAPGVTWEYATYGTSIDATCDAAAGILGRTGRPWVGLVDGTNPNGSQYGHCNNSSGVNQSVSVGQYSIGNYTCPNGGTLTGTYPNQTCNTPYSCPTGYTLSGSTCNPNSGLYAPDGVKGFRNQAGTWVPEPNDPDSVGETLAAPLTQNIVQPNGEPATITITPNADGSITTVTQAQRVNPTSGTTQTTINSYTISANGAVTSATTNIYEGPVTTVVTNNPAPNPSIELPTDYQKDATGQQTNTKLQTIITDGVKVKEEAMPATTGALDTATSALNAKEDALKQVATDAAKSDGKDTGWKISFGAPTDCVNPPAFVLPHANLNWTPDLCSYSSQIGAVASFLWYLLTLGSCLGMIRATANGGAA